MNTESINVVHRVVCVWQTPAPITQPSDKLVHPKGINEGFYFKSHVSIITKCVFAVFHLGSQSPELRMSNFQPTLKLCGVPTNPWGLTGFTQESSKSCWCHCKTWWFLIFLGGIQGGPSWLEGGECCPGFQEGQRGGPQKLQTCQCHLLPRPSHLPPGDFFPLNVPQL